VLQAAVARSHCWQVFVAPDASGTQASPSWQFDSLALVPQDAHCSPALRRRWHAPCEPLAAIGLHTMFSGQRAPHASDAPAGAHGEPSTHFEAKLPQHTQAGSPPSGAVLHAPSLAITLPGPGLSSAAVQAPIATPAATIRPQANTLRALMALSP
jgi:hypothetical protein